jgi:carbamoyl-phosphate synthase large subunit
MQPLTVLLTAAGVPGSAALIRALRENGEREVRIVGTDMAELAIGRHLCDAFHVVPSGTDPGFVDALVEVCVRENVDAVLPQSSYELPALAEARERFEATVLVASPEAVRRSNDKAETYALLDEIGAPGPAWRLARGRGEAEAAARALGYPEAEVAVKPLESSGSRGFRTLSAAADPLVQLLTNRPGVAPALRLEELLSLLPEHGGPKLLVMELARGRERTIDGIAREGRIVLGHPKTREAMRAGLAMYFETLDDPWLLEVASSIVRELALDHFFNIQLVGDTVIEVNPRISTIVYQEDFNLPYLGVKFALGELDEGELAAYADHVRPTRRALRYFDQVEWDDSE